MKLLITLLYVVSVMSVQIPVSVFAQARSTILTFPENPAPNTQVMLTFKSDSFDAATAFITWKIDNVVVAEGEGKTSFSFKTSGVGTSAVVNVTANNKQGYFVDQTVTISPSSLALIYEAPKSFVPFFYEGRSLASTGGTVRFFALPVISEDGTILNPESLSYTWYSGEKNLPSLSGKGRMSVEIPLDYLRSKTEVKVIVRTPRGKTFSKNVSVSAQKVLPTLYLYDEVLGSRYARPLLKRVETTKALGVSLEPYYLSTKENKLPSYLWTLNSLDISPLSGRTLTLVPDENSYGTKQLSVAVSGNDKRLQSAQTSLEIIFDNRK